MRSVEFIDTNVPGAGALGQIPFDPFLAMVASLKTSNNQHLVQSWINPDPAMSIVENGEFKLRDAAGEMVLTGPMDGSSNLLSKTTAINGQATLTTETSSTIMGDFGAHPEALANPEAYSLVVVHNLRPFDETNRHDLIGIGEGGIGTDVLFPGLDVYKESTGTESRLAMREGGTTTPRIFAVFDDADIIDTPVVSMGTFSVANGLSLWVNNVMVASEPSDTRPLTQRQWAFLGNRAGSNYAAGDFGMAFVLRADISSAEYAYARDVILSGLMAKYGIAG
ncbi:hypothetical protein [Halomonas elongata]|uniref:hypothetical protein n=1 Tax=Halomonas elongata TaxID=2746 RepID=UPI00186BAAB1|nr:hypothetical protein [Halomonas elongata]MBW5801202.1 hypothetical protein [Halomonas elongata]